MSCDEVWVNQKDYLHSSKPGEMTSKKLGEPCSPSLSVAETYSYVMLIRILVVNVSRSVISAKDLVPERHFCKRLVASKSIAVIKCHCVRSCYMHGIGEPAKFRVALIISRSLYI